MVEFLSYGRIYGRWPRGYKGSLNAQTIGAWMYPQNVRRIPNRGLDIVDSDLDCAHFNIAAHASGVLVIDIEGAYLELEHVRRYVAHRKETWWISAADYKDSTFRHHRFFNRVCTSAPQGRGAPSVRDKEETTHGITRDGMVIRWISAYAAPDPYADLCAPKK